MWCNRCQQDVPAVARGAGAGVVCARCQQEFAQRTATPGAGISDHGIPLDEPPADRPHDPVASLSDRRTEQRFRNMENLLRRRSRPSPRAGALPGHHWNLPHDLASAAADRADRPPTIPLPKYHPPRPVDRGSQVTAWLCLVWGLFAFGAGIGVLGWSLTENRPEIWNLGIGLTLGGQGFLILGLVLVLLRLWRTSRFSALKLQEMHAQLATIHRSAEAALGSKHLSAPAFYAELARGASPQMLLSNLRGQIEQLASRMDRQA